MAVLELPTGVAPTTPLGCSPVWPPYGPAQQTAAGRRAAALALASAGCGSRLVPREADGRPRFPPGFAGSISHTASLAAAVVVPGAVAVGVDIEDADIDARTAAFVCREEERATLLPPVGGHTARELFAAKEAAFKALNDVGPPGGFPFWRVGLSPSESRLTASYREVSLPVWVSTREGLSFAVAIRR
ncbi:4'-phosphopantetheinyl transferase superfamily protein [Streptomyces sp. NPDC005438]|uniref:4'-phosphopantetheinyl transferase superfamily protein n=1 Tax=Streptomyces sp. NPDC005438 TaxID=3156880 RepID=UPI0033BC58C4